MGKPNQQGLLPVFSCESHKHISPSTKFGVDTPKPTRGALDALTWGFLIQDEQGDVMGSRVDRMDHVQDTLQAQAEAYIQVTSQAIRLGMTKVMVKMDAQLLAQALNNPKCFDLVPNGILFWKINPLAILHFNTLVIGLERVIVLQTH